MRQEYIGQPSQDTFSIFQFPIMHSVPRPKFCINYCCEILVGICRLPNSWSKIWGANRVYYEELENREFELTHHEQYSRMEKQYLTNRKHVPCFYRVLYNNPSYSRILIGSRLWSIRGQMHDWRHHYKVFPSAVLKWRKVLRIRIIFYVTGQKIRYKKVLPRHWTGSRSQKTKDKAVSFRKWYRNNFLAASVGSRARLNHAQTWSW